MIINSRQAADFCPRLAADLHKFNLPNGDLGLQLGENFLRIEQKHATVLQFFDGENSLTQILKLQAATGTFASPSYLISLCQSLGKQKMLANDAKEIRQHGFIAEEKDFILWRYLRFSLLSPRLARGLSRLLSPLAKWLPANPVLLWLTVISLLLNLLLAHFFMDQSHSASRIVLQQPGLSLFVGFAGLWLGLLLRASALMMALGKHGLKADAAGIKFYGPIPLPFLAHYSDFKGGYQAQLSLRLAGLAALSLFSLAMMSIYIFINKNIDLQILLPLMMAVQFVFGLLICPFLPLDLVKALEAAFPQQHIQVQAMSYLRHKFVRGQGQHDFFVGEGRLIFLAAGSLLWIFIAFSLSANFLAASLVPALAQMLSSDSSLDLLALLIVILLATLLLLSALFLFLRWLWRGLTALWPEKKHAGQSFGTNLEQRLQAIKNAPLFMDLDDKIQQELAQNLQSKSYQEKVLILRQGEPGDFYYLILSGEAEVIQEQASGLSQSLAILSTGDGFGEMALLNNRPRNASVRALSKLHCLAIDAQNFAQALQQTSMSQAQATERLRAFQTLRKNPLFAQLSPRITGFLLKALQRQMIVAGQKLIQQGDRADRFYLIASGQFQVQRDGQTIGELAAGDVFGEAALLDGKARNASVICLHDAIVYSLHRIDFIDIFTQDLEISLGLEALNLQRQQPGAQQE